MKWNRNRNKISKSKEDIEIERSPFNWQYSLPQIKRLRQQRSTNNENSLLSVILRKNFHSTSTLQVREELNDVGEGGGGGLVGGGGGGRGGGGGLKNQEQKSTLLKTKSSNVSTFDHSSLSESVSIRSCPADIQHSCVAPTFSNNSSVSLGMQISSFIGGGVRDLSSPLTIVYIFGLKS